MTYSEWKSKRAIDWTTEPLDPECQVLHGATFCGKATVAAYPAHPRGWMTLCVRHARKHWPHCFKVEELIADGERWQ